MKFDPNIHHRRSIRLKNYDYSQPGFYFVTVCVQSRLCLFGQIQDDGMVLNEAGGMVEKWYQEIENKFSDVLCKIHQVMPNHFHAIIQFTEQKKHTHSSLSQIMQWFKTMTTNEYIQKVKNDGWDPFERRLWQRSYYEHIIRDEQSYHKITEYIVYNPAKWQEDKLYVP